jgi:hypothetical protein
MLWQNIIAISKSNVAFLMKNFQGVEYGPAIVEQFKDVMGNIKHNFEYMEA